MQHFINAKSIGQNIYGILPKLICNGLILLYSNRDFKSQLMSYFVREGQD